MKKISLFFIITFLLSTAFAEQTYQAFDVNGKLLYKLVEKSEEISFEYNSNGKLIKKTSSENWYTTYEYDTKGNLIKIKTPGDLIEEFSYDSEGNKTYSETAVGPEFYIISAWYEYDFRGNLIYEKQDDPRSPAIDEYHYQYDSKNNLICKSHTISFRFTEETLDSEETWFEYDEKGNCIHEKAPDYEIWYEYDSKGNLVHEKNSSGYETWYYNIYNSMDQMIKQLVFISI